MPEVFVVGLLVAVPAIGAAARRWPALLVPLVAWPMYFLGLEREWWGYGVGDGWQLGASVLTAFGVATTAIAIAAGRRLWPPGP
jgi:hypothetical protein